MDYDNMMRIAVAYPLTLLNNGVAVLVGIGSASVLSRAIGRDDQQTVDKIMGNLLTLVFLLSLLTTIVGYFFSRQLLSFSRVEGDMLVYAINYLKIIFLGSFFVNFAQAANMVMRGEGKMMAAMIFMAIGAVLNITLDPIFIKVLGYGVEGAAIATVIAQVVQFLITMVYFIKFSDKVRFKKIRLEPSILSGVISVGVSACGFVNYIRHVVPCNWQRQKSGYADYATTSGAICAIGFYSADGSWLGFTWRICQLCSN